MLTKEDILKIEGVTEDQAVYIAGLSERDETKVIGERIGKIYSDLDKDILEKSGVAKITGEKTYAYLKRTFDLSKDDGEAAKKLEELQKKYDKLEKDKSGEVVAKDLEDSKALVKQLRADIKTKEETYEADLKAKDKASKDVLVRSSLRGELKKDLFKADIDQDIIDMMVNKSIDDLMNNQDITKELGDNGKVVFRDKAGQIIRNDERFEKSGLEILSPSLKSVLEDKKASIGVGGKGDEGGTGHGGFSVSAKDKGAAILEIREHLVSNGVLKGSAEFTKQQSELLDENGFGEKQD